LRRGQSAHESLCLSKHKHFLTHGSLESFSPKKPAEKIIPIKSEAAQARKNVLKNTVRWLTSCRLMFSYGQNADF